MSAIVGAINNVSVRIGRQTVSGTECPGKCMLAMAEAMLHKKNSLLTFEVNGVQANLIPSVLLPSPNGEISVTGVLSIPDHLPPVQPSPAMCRFIVDQEDPTRVTLSSELLR